MPKTTAEIARDLARLSSDCSFLLTHLVRQNDGRSDADSKAILESILDLGGAPPQPVINASSIGWYGTACANIFNPLTNNLDGPINNRAVCFTESTLAGLKAHRDTFSVKYGIAFDRDMLFGKGANPCLNIRESLFNEEIRLPGEMYPKHVYNYVPHQLHPFVNIVHESFDATHEREWRIATNVDFTYADVMFVFCPQAEFYDFSAVQTSGMPALFDLAWLDRV